MIKLFEEFQESIDNWTENIMKNDDFYKWYDENMDDDELRNGYDEYVHDKKTINKNYISYVNWCKKYYNEL
jgi:hypothetical protein